VSRDSRSGAREVHLSRKDRKVLEACCRSPVTLQRDLKRARMVLLAAAGRSTRSIAKEVGVQPRIVSLWRHRYADHGLEGLKDKPRPGKQPIYTKATDKRILRLLNKPPPKPDRAPAGGAWAMLTSNMSGGSCAVTRLTSRLASPGVRATTRTLQPKPPMLLASTSPLPRRPLCYAWTKSPRSRLWSERRAI
jgi:hypothetical protein